MAETQAVNSDCPKPLGDKGWLLSKELLDACIHCGLCLPACPTYLATGREMESPRGRIYLLTQLNNGDLPLSKNLTEHIDSCLGCLGCQTACPSGVQYEQILNQARPLLVESKPKYLRSLMRFGFKQLLPHYGRLRLFGRLVKLWQDWQGSYLLRMLAGVKEGQTLVGDTKDGSPRNSVQQLFHKLWQCDSLLPEVPSFKPLKNQSWRSGEKKGTVQLFAGCVMDVFYNHVNHAAVDLLHAQRRVVEVPQQTCCGALASHAGERDIAISLAKQNIELFERSEGPIAVTAAGCGAMLKEYPELLAAEPEWHERAEKFKARVVDITEELTRESFEQTQVKPVSARKVAYHAACHLAHAQGVRQAPQKLVTDLALAANTAGSPMEIIPLHEAEHCCGSAGIYNLIHTELSMEVLARKMDFIAESGADTIVTTNPGCILQLKAGVKERNMNVEVLHLCELMQSLYCPKESGAAQP